MTSVVFFGDSITAGANASSGAAQWSGIVQAVRGYGAAHNAGIAGTTLQNSVQNTVTTLGGATTNNGRDRYVADVLSHSPTHVYICYGLNDLRLNDPGFSAENYRNDLAEVVGGLIAAGVPNSQIVIGSPPHIPAASYALHAPYDGGSQMKHEQYAAAAQSVATQFSTRFADVYHTMIRRGADALIDTDGIHPTDMGHRVIADAMLAADGGGAWTATFAFTPAETTAQDTWIWSATAGVNYATNGSLWVGAPSSAGGITRSLLKFNLDWLPEEALVTATTLSLYLDAEQSSNASSLRVYRQRRKWTETGATWTDYNGVNSWQSVGGFGANDAEATEIGSLSLSATETTGVLKNIPLSPTSRAGLDLGNGWLLKTVAEVNDGYNFLSSSDATAAKRPKLSVSYSMSASVGAVSGGASGSVSQIVSRSASTIGSIIVWTLGPAYQNATLRSKLYDLNGVQIGGEISAGFYKRPGSGGIFVQYLPIVSSFVGWCDIYEAGAPGNVLMSAPVGDLTVGDTSPLPVAPPYQR